MSFLIPIAKKMFLHLAIKYAAELVFKHVIIALESAAESSETTLDDEIVDIIKKEQDFIINTIKGR